ncbi:MAG: hypothetical protein A2430_02035 [Candidatus Liptonbacteria bacterium RIFOXYC1_FULL_36_8]|uniref:Aminotransferase n=3 Tax=Candidatus Liptoniibacteriota TaxID=1817909 RepID=A0A1G2CNT3_9BACT|nr:MAG: hypothetical protein A2390_02765 [Candidatus Liptonbacteria bacterium RIFOXYB1_FULL_36_10]OGZ03509.1 MAG: hypothetical protein A2430_02035 [Candidatus Liptonbacteria bacterium RIFOXYC1_FULL_36_8]
MRVPFLNPDIRDSDVKRMIRSVKTGWLVYGPQAKMFEREFADFLKVKDVALVGSCTAALRLSLILAGVEDGDEVITTPLSYVATSNVIIEQGAIPVFVDVDPKTGLIDLNKIEERITKKTKVIIPVHLYGQMVDIKKLSIIAEKNKIKIIEDAAHAIESKRDGYSSGQLSFSACFSFHAAKNITCGQGGALVSKDGELVKKARILRRDGVVNINNKRMMVDFGYKYDGTDFQVALLRGQLKRIETTHKKREKILNRYVKAFKKTGIGFPLLEKETVHSGHVFVIWVDPKKRDEIRNKLADRGIETSIHYTPIHLEPYYQKRFNFKEGDFPEAERLGASTITLPTYSKLTKKQQEYVIRTVNSTVSGVI